MPPPPQGQSEGGNAITQGRPAVLLALPSPLPTQVCSQELTISSGSGGGSWATRAARFFCFRFFRSSIRFWMPPTSMISRRRSKDVLRTRSWPCVGMAVNPQAGGVGTLC